MTEQLSDIQRAALEVRQRDLEREQKNEEENLKNRRKNKGFTQVYPLGWRQISEIGQRSSGALKLYTFFAENLDPNCGAIVADQQFLADQLNVTDRTIRTYVSILENMGAVVKIPLAGRMFAYALDPEKVWTGFNTSKEYASFNSKTLVNKDGNIVKRLKLQFSNKEKKE